jgi:hypothetical protein
LGFLVIGVFKKELCIKKITWFYTLQLEFFFFKISYFVYIKIWQNCLMDDHHSCYITKLKRKTLRFYELELEHPPTNLESCCNRNRRSSKQRSRIGWGELKSLVPFSHLEKSGTEIFNFDLRMNSTCFECQVGISSFCMMLFNHVPTSPLSIPSLFSSPLYSF